MAIAHARKFTGQFEIIGEAVFHGDWEEPGYYGEYGERMQGEKVTVMRGKDGSMHVVPTEEIDEHFQVVP